MFRYRILDRLMIVRFSGGDYSFAEILDLAEIIWKSDLTEEWTVEIFEVPRGNGRSFTLTTLEELVRLKSLGSFL